jgi:UDP-N-acetylglucosamine 2-epimerase (non-hydrolysing)
MSAIDGTPPGAPTIVCIVGTRPEAIKLAPVIRALREQGWARVRVIATGQHRGLLDQALGYFDIVADRDLDLMRPDQPLTELTARMLPALDEALRREQAAMVIAQGDTTTVFVAALACFYRRIPFSHVEAGLRTGDRWYPFPEEMNRVLVSRLTDLHFCPTDAARLNLIREGVAEDRVLVTGNTVIDALLWTVSQTPTPATAPGRRTLLLTAHRRENFGEPLEQIFAAIRDIADRRDVDVIYPVHPNPNVMCPAHRILGHHPRIRLVAPLEYPAFVAAMNGSHLVLTDSGGVQEEAPALAKPVLVLRNETERPEGVAAGTACVVGPNRQAIVTKVLELLDNPAAYATMAHAANPYGDGHAADRITAALLAHLQAVPCGAPA